MPDEIDICIVSGRRPDLLARTLETFGDRVFRHFRIARAWANIDPFGGSPSEGEACAELLRRALPGLTIFQPQAPGFGAAVQRLWQATGDRPVLHLEDDWLALTDLRPTDIAELGHGVSMLQLAKKPRAPGQEGLHLREVRTRVLGLTLRRRRANHFGTSPRFLAPGVAWAFAAVIDPEFDPEKQLYLGRNPRMERLSADHPCRLLFAPDGGAAIRDIGRDWLAEQGLRKDIDRDGRPIWHPAR